MNATMKDVAAYAGVSVATVSHVVNNRGIVKDETRQKVLKAIKDLNYYPDIAARTFKTGKRNAIGFVVPDIGSNFFASMIEEIENILSQKDYKLIVANSREDRKKELEIIQLMASGLVDGLLLSSAFRDFKQMEERLPQKKNFPIISVGREIAGCPFDSVTISDYHATYQGLENLILKGHKRIGYIGGRKHLSPVKERLKAYYDVLEKYHIPIEEGLIKNVKYHAFTAIKELIAEKCTVLVASTNSVTYDAIIYFLNNNISLSKDIALIGYINDGSTSTELTNMIQVIHPIKELSVRAVDQLFERMENPSLPIKNTVLMGRYVPPQF